MLVFITAASILCFMIVFWLADIVTVARSAIATANQAMKSIRDPALDDLAREKTVQAAAVRMIGLSASLIGRSLLALIAAAVPIFAADWFDLVPLADSLAFMERWDVILIATLVVVAGYLAARRLWPG